MKQKIIRALEIILTVFLIVLILYILNIQINSNRNPTKLPSFFGYRHMTVLTGSMRPSIEPGDIVVSKEVQPEHIRTGDVITYRISKSTSVTHRVVEVITNRDRLMYSTKGDYNNTKDSELVNTEQLIGRVIFRIPKAGYIGSFIRKPFGFILLIIIPIVFLFTRELRTVLSRMEKDGKQNNTLDDTKN